MKVALRATVVLVPILLAFGPVAGPVAAAEGSPGLTLTSAKGNYAVGEPVALTFTVTNTSTAGCQIATFAGGTITLTGFTRDGVAVSPTLTPVRYAEGFDAALRGQLRTLAPGERASFPALLLGGAIDTESPLPSGSAIAAQWPVDAPGRYELTATYAMLPIAKDVCPAVLGPAAVSFTVGDNGPLRTVVWLAAGAAVVLLLLAAAFLVRRARRRGRPPVAGTTALLVVVALALAVGARPAHADIIIDPYATQEFKDEAKNCLDVIKFPGNISPQMLKDLTKAKPDVLIAAQNSGVPSKTFPTPNAPGGKGSSGILWNYKADFKHIDDGQLDPCAELVHELVHAWQLMTKGWSNKYCDDTEIETDDVEASLIENQFRVKRKLTERTTYDGHKLPTSMDECKKPQTKPVRLPNGGGDPNSKSYQDFPSGGTDGDPHVMTIDQRYYDLQAVGEFVVLRSKTGDLEVQTRQSPWAGSRRVSVNSAAAVKVGPDRVGFYLVDRKIEVRLGGQPVQLPEGDRSLPGGGTLTNRSDGYAAGAYTLTAPDRSTITIDPIGGWGLRVLVWLAPSRHGQISGLLGNFDGDPANDPAGKDGTVLPKQPTYDQLYRAFGDSWRISPAESLFDYPAGKGTDSYTDRTFPDPSPNPAIPEQARAICAFAGVTTPERLDACALDVTVTGQPAFAVDAGTTQAAVPAAVPGTLSTLDVTSNGQPAVQTFTGTAGQKVFVQVLAATVPDRCGNLRLEGPNHAALASGCIIGGQGYLDATELPATATYSIVLDLGPSGTGQATVRLSTVTDQKGPIAVNGDPADLVVGQPGATGRLTFSATPGQKVFVEVLSSTMSDACGVLSVRRPGDDASISAGCIISGTGLIDTTLLPNIGEYSIVLDPGGLGTGTARARLTAVTDQIGTITVDGPAVAASVSQFGAVSAFSFAGTAGQKVTIEVVSATVPDECGWINLQRPGDNAVIGFGCVGNGKGTTPVLTLPTTGTYRVVVDPPGTQTGDAQLKLHGAA